MRDHGDSSIKRIPKRFIWRGEGVANHKKLCVESQKEALSDQQFEGIKIDYGSQYYDTSSRYNNMPLTEATSTSNYFDKTLQKYCFSWLCFTQQHQEKFRVRHLTFFFQLVLISWMATLSSCLIWQIISFILPPNEYGWVYAWTTYCDRSTYRRCRKNHYFRWSSFWSWQVCKQAKLSPLGHRQPACVL